MSIQCLYSFFPKSKKCIKILVKEDQICYGVVNKHFFLQWLNVLEPSRNVSISNPKKWMFPRSERLVKKSNYYIEGPWTVERYVCSIYYELIKKEVSPPRIVIFNEMIVSHCTMFQKPNSVRRICWSPFIDLCWCLKVFHSK